jgi:C4-dicarboxylate-specific signal transduction histidine kinase
MPRERRSAGSAAGRRPRVSASPDAGQEAEQALDRLAAQMRALAEITPAVAHDLRAPINAMVLNLEVLKETIDRRRGGPDDEERQQRYVAAVREELHRLHRSLEIFIAHISPRSSRVEAFNLGELVTDLAALLRAPAHKRQIEVRVAVPPAPVAVTANRYFLRQALLHFGLAALATVRAPGELLLELVAAEGRARLCLSAAPSLGEPHSSVTLAQLEVARALLADESGTVRSLSGSRIPDVNDRSGVFELELPLSEVAEDASRARG